MSSRHRFPVRSGLPTEDAVISLVVLAYVGRVEYVGKVGQTVNMCARGHTDLSRAAPEIKRIVCAHSMNIQR